MESHAEDQENRNRRNNLHLAGFPEGVEGHDPAAYTKQTATHTPTAGSLLTLLRNQTSAQDAICQGTTWSTAENLHFPIVKFSRSRSCPEGGEEDG